MAAQEGGLDSFFANDTSLSNGASMNNATLDDMLKEATDMQQDKGMFSGGRLEIHSDENTSPFGQLPAAAAPPPSSNWAAASNLGGTNTYSSAPASGKYRLMLSSISLYNTFNNPGEAILIICLIPLYTLMETFRSDISQLFQCHLETRGNLMFFNVEQN